MEDVVDIELLVEVVVDVDPDVDVDVEVEPVEDKLEVVDFVDVSVDRVVEGELLLVVVDPAEDDVVEVWEVELEYEVLLEVYPPVVEALVNEV